MRGSSLLILDDAVTLWLARLTIGVNLYRPRPLVLIAPLLRAPSKNTGGRADNEFAKSALGLVQYKISLKQLLCHVLPHETISPQYLRLYCTDADANCGQYNHLMKTSTSPKPMPSAPENHGRPKTSTHVDKAQLSPV